MLQPGHSLQNGRYLLTRFVRAGGAGVVWAAHDRRPRKGDTTEVAIKVLDAVAGGTDAAAREAEVAARVRHPNVVRVRDTFVEDGLSCMVMDLARCSLADLVAREGPLSPPIALGCALQACAALAEAHRAGVVHRDVKPHNLLVFGDGSVRLGDFGAARALMDGHTRTRTGALLGSIPFMAPEQRRDPRAVRPSTDVYALAVTLAWLLLGEAPDDPWTEEAAAQLRAAGTPPGLVRAIATGGARRAEHRPQDANAYLAILEACGVVAAPVAQNDVDAARVDRHGSGEMPAWVGGVEQLGAGGSRPPQRPRVWIWGMGVVTVATLAAALLRMTSHAGRDAPTAQVQPPTPYPACGTLRGLTGARRPGPEEAVGATVADMDGDDTPDIVVVYQQAARAIIYWGGTRLIDAPTTEIPIERGGGPPALADLDGDGVTDIVIAEPDLARLTVVRGRGARVFGTPEALFQSDEGRRPHVTDWDADGLPDLLLDMRDKVHWRRQRTRGAFDAHTAIVPDPLGWDTVMQTASGPLVLALDPDHGAILRAQPGESADAVAVLTRIASPWADPERLDARLPADVDGDGNDELYIVPRDGGPLLQWNPDDGKTCVLLEGSDMFVRSPPSAAADLNRDGRVDFVQPVTCAGCTSSIEVWTGT